MTVCSIEFLVLLLSASAVFFWIPNVPLRQAFLAACNFGFLYTLVPDGKAWVALGVFLSSGYAAARLVQVRPRAWIAAAYLTALIGTFLVIKKYEFLSLLAPAGVWSHAIVIVGLSYMLFRQIHVVVDAREGQMGNLNFWTFLNYQANLFSLAAGPIQRYQDFAQAWSRLAPLHGEPGEILRTYRRLFVGILKIAVVAALCLAVYDHFAESLAASASGPAWKNLVKFLAVFYLYPAYIYFNFSGYCDIVISGARLFGLSMPENFDWPFLSRNLIEYWTRFHMTLGLWIRDYIFTPLYKTVAAAWPERAASFAFLCYFAAFFLAGIWHGSTWNFVIYGLLNGLGVAVVKLWENYLVKRRGRQGFKRYLTSRPIRLLAVATTFHFVCLTILFFPGDLPRTFRILANVAPQLQFSRLTAVIFAEEAAW